MLWLLTFLIGITIQPYNGRYVIPEANIHYINNFFPDSTIDYRIDREKNCIYITAKGIPIAAFPDRQTQMLKKQAMRSDGIVEIWFPDSTGGVLYPEEFVLNSLNNKVYVIGRYFRNVAVCEAETGVRVRTIQTGRGTISLGYNATNNKVYCTNFYDSTVSVIDGATDTIIKNIKIASRPYDLAWNNINNAIYCAIPYCNNVAVIDGVADTLITEIPIRNYPSRLLFNSLSNKIYCISQTDVSIINCNNNNVISSIPVNFGYLLAFNSTNNKVYCVSSYDDNVSIIDGVGDTLITTVALNDLSTCIAYSSVMNRVYIGHGPTHDIYVINGNTNQIITTINLGEWTESMVCDLLDNRLFVATDYDRAIVIDCSTNGIIGYLPAGVLPQGIFWDGDYNQIWIANTGAGNVPGYTLDGYSGDLLQHQFRTPIGLPPYSSAFNNLNNKHYSTSRADNYISLLNLNSPGKTNLKKVKDGPRDLVYNSLMNKIYCANRWDNRISIIEGNSDSTITEVWVGSSPVALALNLTDNKIYSANSGADNVSVIDGNSNNYITTVPVGSSPYSLLWNSIDNKIYTGNFGEGTVSIIDSHVDTVLTTINVGTSYWGLSFTLNTVNDKVYCANYASDTITVIDGITNQIVTIIYLGADKYPFTLAYNSVNNKVYSANIFEGSISIIDGNVDSVITTIPVNGGPYSLLYNPIDNALYCAYVNTSQVQDAIMIIDGETNSIIDDFSIDSYISGYGVDSPQKALVLDSLDNIIYLCHYYTSKISKIEGLVQGIEKGRNSPVRFPLLKVFPNPFVSCLEIEYSLPKLSHVGMQIYDVSGRLVESFPSEVQETGKHRISWMPSGKNLKSGVYFVRMNIGKQNYIKKVIFLPTK
ncbi:MAG: T9SS type A sorting domain-containing protein [Candidatus Cloacimonadota bacterium]|nr:MAG: T9SS type A sorting domain-containing protein [Candidatus Cloacimonadota bacterium]